MSDEVKIGEMEGIYNTIPSQSYLAIKRWADSENLRLGEQTESDGRIQYPVHGECYRNVHTGRIFCRGDDFEQQSLPLVKRCDHCPNVAAE